MKYYKVKSEHDNKRKPGAKYDIYVANELYTEKEAEKQHINKSYCELVEIPKNQVYFFFGARFEYKKGV